MRKPAAHSSEQETMKQGGAKDQHARLSVCPLTPIEWHRCFCTLSHSNTQTCKKKKKKKSQKETSVNCEVRAITPFLNLMKCTYSIKKKSQCKAQNIIYLIFMDCLLFNHEVQHGH